MVPKQERDFLLPKIRNWKTANSRSNMLLTLETLKFYWQDRWWFYIINDERNNENQITSWPNTLWNNALLENLAWLNIPREATILSTLYIIFKHDFVFYLLCLDSDTLDNSRSGSRRKFILEPIYFYLKNQKLIRFFTSNIASKL